MQPIRPGRCHTPGDMMTETPALVPVPESELIERVLNGDASAERTLYEEHVDRV
jgi:hypothetical protein